MKYSKIIIGFCACLIVSGISFSKPHLGPPSIQLRANLSNTTVLKLVEISAEYVLKFTKIEDLYNEASSEILLAGNKQIASQLIVGRKYIISYNKHYVDGYSKKVFLREGAAVIANIPGAEPAIFAENNEIKKMFAYDLDNSSKSPLDMLEIILKGIENEDPQIRNFFMTELLTRPALKNKVTKKQFKKIFNLFDNVNTSLLTKEFMLLHGSFPDSIMSEENLYKLTIMPLKYMPVNLDLGSTQASYIRVIFRKIEPIIRKEDSEIVSRWLKSNSSSVVQSAAKLLHKINHKQEILYIKQAYKSTLLDKNTRQTLKNLLTHI